MFERFTGNARKSVFFARYEASHFGCPEIETEHLLLGILRTDNDLALRLLPSPAAVEAIRDRIGQQPRERRKIALSTDLPLTLECKRIMGYAAEEADRLREKRIGTMHLLLAIAREESCLGAKLLSEHGITRVRLSEEAGATISESSKPAAPVEPSLPAGCRDLSAAAREETLGPLIGRERELEQALQVLSRRGRNNVALIGESGVGRTTIVEALAGRIAFGTVPAHLAGRPVFAVDAGSLTASGEPGRRAQYVQSLLAALLRNPHPVLCVESLFDLAAAGSGWAAVEAMHVLESQIARGAIQCVATGTPSGLQQTFAKVPLLAERFEVVHVPPPSEEEARQILLGVKRRYEEFHGVTFAAGAIDAAVRASGRFLRNRHLPDRALDLLDEAGARARLQSQAEPRDILDARRKIRQHAKAMESAIARHEFDKARQHSDEERAGRENLVRLLEARGPAPPRNRTITAADIEEVVAQRIGAPVEAVRRALAESEPAGMERISVKLAAHLPPDTRDWLPILAAWLQSCSPEEAERLAHAILAAKGLGK